MGIMIHLFPLTLTHLPRWSFFTWLSLSPLLSHCCCQEGVAGWMGDDSRQPGTPGCAFATRALVCCQPSAPLGVQPQCGRRSCELGRSVTASSQLPLPPV